jgi:hypothetical protein
VLLLVPRRTWPVLIPAGVAGFVVNDLQFGFKPWTIALLNAADAIEILIICLGLGYCFDGVPRLSSVNALAKYCFFAVLLGPFASAFLIAFAIPGSYVVNWRIWFFFSSARFSDFDSRDLELVHRKLRVWFSWILSIKGRSDGPDRRPGYFRIFRFTHSFENNARRVGLFSRAIPVVVSLEIRFDGSQHVNSRSFSFGHLGDNSRTPFAGPEPSRDVLSLQLFL